jgi:starch-binding outer membrane protein, SusD/RagB family
MRHGIAARARWTRAAGTLGVASLLFSACNLRHELVAPATPGVIDDNAAAGPTGASGLRIGAIGSLKLQTGSGETLWQLGGLLADEWKSSNSAAATNEIDRRAVTTSNASVTAAYNNIQQSRGYFRDAIAAMNRYLPDNKSQIGELYFGLGFIEMQIAEDFCNGVPFGTTDNGMPVYGPPNTNVVVFNLAAAHLDSALSFANTALTVGIAGDTAFARSIRNAVMVAKARVLVDLGQFGAAAALTPVVPTNFQYTLTFSTGSGVNGNWNLNASQLAYSVSDSVDPTGVVKNAIPFVSAKDPRVPTANANKLGIDGVTPMFTQSIWAQTGAIPLVSGVDARLIEAEAKLQTSDFAGMIATLNSLRTTAQTLGTFKPALMTALPTPTSAAAATTTFFREKAFWTFGRGQRLGDLRRMIRQYNGAASAFPTGNYFKGGTFGTDVNLPVPDAERVNPLFTGCIDRNA